MKPSSRSSNESNVSVGIGALNDYNNQHQVTKDRFSLVKLRPVSFNFWTCNQTYDCMVFVMYCGQHDKLAVTQVDSEIVWFPFVPRQGRNWRKVAVYGIAELLGRIDSDGTIVRYPPQPSEYYSRPIEIVRLQMVDHRWYTRMAEMVWITKCENTCEPVNNIIWMDATELLDKGDYIFWGPEFDQFYHRCKNQQVDHIIVTEYNVQHIVRHITDTLSSDMLQSLLNSCNVGSEILYDLYEDYLNHTYPVYFMSWCNFYIYLRKLGFSGTVPITKGIFNACIKRPNRTKKDRYLDFFDLCYMVAIMDPQTPTEEERIRFIFNFYDQDGDGILNHDEITWLNMDNNSSINLVNLTFSQFQEISQQCLPKIDSICRLPTSVLSNLQIKGTIKSHSNRNSSSPLIEHKFIRPRFMCPSCRVKKFELGQHCVTIDTLGRCVDPNLIINCTEMNLKSTGKNRYSIECSFSTNSVGNIIFDFIRNRKLKLKDERQNTQAFTEQFLVLCDQVALLAKHEPKLVKRSSPVIVIGDLQGRLESLLAMENVLWCGIPIIGDDLLFLGNFTGHTLSNQAFDVLVYLFAIKYISPNKVLLLRGIQETRKFNQQTLLTSWENRFGNVTGNQLWKAVNNVFDQLPYIAVVNESVLCASSGIPKEAVKQRLDILFGNLFKECATTHHQVLTNLPNHNQRSSEVEMFTPLSELSDTFTFNCTAFYTFLRLNKLTHMIRSNESISEGYRLCFSQRCITIDSNHNRNIETNDYTVAVVININHSCGKIQFIQIEKPK